MATDRAGNVYVVDFGNSRIQKFTSDGAFIAKWGNRPPRRRHHKPRRFAISIR